MVGGQVSEADSDVYAVGGLADRLIVQGYADRGIFWSPGDPLPQAGYWDRQSEPFDDESEFWL